MRKVCAILDQTFQPRWSQVRNYPTGELSTLRGPQDRTSSEPQSNSERALREPQGREPVESVEPVYGTDSSEAPSDTR